MRWKNIETPTFEGNAGSGNSPAVVETMQLLDKDGQVVGSFTKAVDGTFSFAMGDLSATEIGYLDGVTSNIQTQLDTKIATAAAIRMAYAKYSFAVDGGAVSTNTPATTTALPDNAIIIGGTVNSTTAVTSGGSATVAIGTSAGSSTTAILAVTAKSSFSADAVINAVPVLATPVKLTASGSITFTIGTAALTAGVIEVWLYYVVAAA